MPDKKSQTSETRFPRRTAKRQQTRARILEVALAEFKRVGFADTTMNAIAEAADIHVTTLFMHFKSKRELADTLDDAELDALEEDVERARGSVPFFDFFRALVLRSAEERQRTGDPKRGVGRETPQNPELALSWMRYRDRESRLFARYIAFDYGLDPVADPTASLAAEVLISSTFVAWSRWRRCGGNSDLLGETVLALDLGERMARAILPLRPVQK